MIPDRFKPCWKDGLTSNDFSLKLCGSGGGGYLLGFTENLTKTQKYFKEKQIDIITVYKSSKV
jgi:mevalonate kinase